MNRWLGLGSMQHMRAPGEHEADVTWLYGRGGTTVCEAVRLQSTACELLDCRIRLRPLLCSVVSKARRATQLPSGT